MQPDQWTDEHLWKQVLSTHRIIVSTPQVLLDALRHGYVNMGRDIGLLVFDEAHHATDKHPYNMIMREFYDFCSPRATSNSTSENVRPFVLGLTASPAFGGNIGKAFQCVQCLCSPGLSSDISRQKNRAEFGCRDPCTSRKSRRTCKICTQAGIQEDRVPASFVPSRLEELCERSGPL